MAETVYTIAPIPPDPAHTTYVEAGAVSFGIEYRLLDDAELAANYQGADMEKIREALRDKQVEQVEDNGISIHVVAAADGHEYLRFDAFDDDPHYHYVRPSGDHNHWISFDPVSGGDMLAFALRSLRERLGPMLREAQGEEVAALLQPDQQKPVIDEVERLAYEIRKRA